MDTKEITKNFEELKSQLKFNATYEELDDIFFITDFLNEKGHISNKFSRQLIGRMIDTFAKWNEFFHRILLPTPGSIVVSEESQIFDEKDRKEIMIIFNQIMELISRNSVIGVSKDNSKEGEFIDELLKFWKDNQKNFVKYLQMINKMWNEKSHQKTERVSYSG